MEARSPPSTEEAVSGGGANFCVSRTGSAELIFGADSSSTPDNDAIAEVRFASMVLPRMEPLERAFSGGGGVASGSVAVSRDMPGSCLLSGMAAPSEVSSSWFFLYAAEPIPRSGVCLNHVGSFAPSDCAIWDREAGRSGEGGSEVRGELAARERGLRMLADCGRRCCHDKVPERPSAAALGAGFFGSMSSRTCSGEPVNWRRESSRAVSCEGGSMVGAGASWSLSWSVSWTLRGVSATERCDCGVVGLSGDRERARSGVLVSSQANAGQVEGWRTCPAREAFTAALDQLLLELFDPLCVLLVSLLRHGAHPLKKLARIDVVWV